MLERLNAINKLCNKHKWIEADEAINNLYEEFASGDVRLNQSEEEYMFLLMDKIMWNYTSKCIRVQLAL